MMDSTRQAEEMVRTWADAQRKMWDSWFDALEGPGAFQGTEAWAKSLDVSKESMTRALDNQAEGTRLWAESLITWAGQVQETAERDKAAQARVQGTRVWAESLAAWARQVQEMTKSWTDAQKQLWEAWFETAKRLDWSRPGGAGGEEGRKLIEAWQDSVRTMLDAQAEWARTWTTGQARPRTARKRGPEA
jgi:hypothetical protein